MNVQNLLASTRRALDLLFDRPSFKALRLVPAPPERVHTPAATQTSDGILTNERILRPSFETVTLFLTIPGIALEHPLEITIDKTRKEIVVEKTTLGLLGHPLPEGSVADVGLSIALFLVALWPLVIPHQAYYLHLEKRDGLSRHGRAILDALKTQLDAETEQLLREALRREQRRRHQFNPRTSFSIEEAETRLRSCTRYVTSRCMDSNGKVSDMGCEWRNTDGDVVAKGYIDYTDHGGTEVQFEEGPRFYRQQAARLINCFSTHVDLLSNPLSD
jgi:hypothetical protein